MMASLVRPIALTNSGNGGAIGAVARPVENVLEREVQRMRLMDRDLENAGGDLHRAGEAPGRRVQRREAGRD